MGKSAWSDWVPPDRSSIPNLVPIFGPKTWDAMSTCQDVHPNGPMPSGSRCVCMACHKSGVEHLVRGHTKPGNGTLRDGWEQPEPTKYTAPPKGLKGGRK